MNRLGQKYYQSVFDDVRKTDANGDLFISGLAATDGHEYLITARGTGFYYTKRVTTPSHITLGGSEAVEVRLLASSADITLGGAAVYAELEIDGVITGNFESSSSGREAESRVKAELGKVNPGQLMADGRGSLWLSPGDHQLYVVDSAPLYVLTRAVSVPATGSIGVDLSAEIAAAVPLTLSPGTGDSPDYLGLTLDLNDTNSLSTMIGMEFFTPGQPVFISPGTYTLVGKSYYQSAPESVRYNCITTALGRLEILAATTINMGGVVNGQRFTLDYLQNVESPASILAGETLRVKLRYVDHSGNPLINTGYVDTFAVPDGGTISSVNLVIKSGYQWVPQPGLYRWNNGNWVHVHWAYLDEAVYALQTGEHTYRFDPYWTETPGDYKVTCSVLFAGAAASPTDELLFTVGAAQKPNLVVSGTLDGTNPWGLKWDYATVVLYVLTEEGYQPYLKSPDDYEEGYYILGDYNSPYNPGTHVYQHVPFTSDQPLAVVLYGKNGQQTSGNNHYTLLYDFFTLDELLNYDEATHTYTVELKGTDYELVQTHLSSFDEAGEQIDSLTDR
jgi:hypothetical protein